MIRRASILAAFGLVLGFSWSARAQTTVYHLHKEINFSPYLLMTTAAANDGSTSFASADLKNTTLTDRNVASFITSTGVSGTPGILPAQSTIRFVVYMKKSANWGVMYPLVKLYVNAYVTLACAAEGSTQNPPTNPISQTLTPFTVTCATSTAVTVTATDRWFVDVGVHLTTLPGNHSVTASVAVETPTDSTVEIPALVPIPTITAATDALTNLNSGPGNSVVTITGTGFGSTTGTVKFGTTPSTPTNWASAGNSITVPVPTGISGQNSIVVTTAGSIVSAAYPFNVVQPPTLTGLNPSTAHLTDSVTITGSNFLGNQGTSTVKFGTVVASTINSWIDGSISVAVPAGATSATSDVTVTVSGQTSNAKVFTLIPPPTLMVAAPSSGHRGDSVTIFGTDFGSAQGTNTVTFHSVPATATNWSNSSITATVPTTATTGDLVVSISGQPSNPLPFTVLIAGTMSGAVTRATGGSAVAGASVQAVLTGVVNGTATTAADGTYAIANLDPGSYDVRVFATGLAPELRSGQTVTPQANTTVNVQMYAPGSVTGHVTQPDGTTPIAGAAIAVYSGPTQKGTASTNSTGDYTIANLHPGAFTVQAANVGYTTAEQGASVAENAATTKNFILQGAPSNPVLYAYDVLGRLVQVTDPAGESAIYRYDPVGNITSIDRPGTTGVKISDFTPIAGLVGDSVTISGTNFSPVPAQNQVTFNGTGATVTQAAPTQLVVTVPAVTASETPYSIGVAAPGGSASKSGFIVKADLGIPTITGFNPTLASAGTALTINGTNFDPIAGNDRLTLNASFAQVTSPTTTSMQTTIPPSAFTGHVAVGTPNGTATSTNYLWIPPPSYSVAQLDQPDSTATLPYGVDTPVSVTVANKIKLLAFDGIEGHRVAISAPLTGGNYFAHLYGPFGTVLRTSDSSGIVDTVTLPATATYSVVFDPWFDSASATLKLYDVPADFASPIGFGAGAAVTFATSPGQNGRLTFAASAGQRVAVDEIGFTCSTAHTSILKPDGASLASICGGFIDTTALPTAGTYTILMDPAGTNEGSTTVTLYDVPADFTSAIGFGTSNAVAVTTAVGQNGVLTFNGTVGQRIAVNQAGYNCNQSQTTIHKPNPDGTANAAGPLVGQPACGGAFIDTLPVAGFDLAGIYSIVVNPETTVTGSTTVTLYDVPPDDIKSTTVDASSGVSLLMDHVGQNGQVTFQGSQNQQVRVRVTGNTVGGWLWVKLMQGTTLVAQALSPNQSFDLGLQTLPANGTYTIVVDPDALNTGSATISVTSS